MLASLRNLLWPRQRRRQPAAAMGTISRLPEDVFTAKVAGYFSKQEYLSLRALCASGRDAARRAIRRAEHPEFSELRRYDFGPPLGSRPPRRGRSARSAVEMRARPQHVVAIGKFFGPGCESLCASGISRDALSAICSFVVFTEGSLRELNLEYAAISKAAFVHLCRLSPRLTRLVGPKCRHLPEDAIHAISVACPELVSVSLFSRYTPAQVQEVLGDAAPPLPRKRYYTYSPAETWAIRFPKLETLSLNDGSIFYRPTRLRALRAAATATNATKLDVENCEITRDVVEALVGTPFGDRLVTIEHTTSDYDDPDYEDIHETRFEPDALIAAARGFPRLRELWIPRGWPMGGPASGPAFYEDLGRVGNLTTLSISAPRTTDACVAAVCKHSRLESLRLDGLEFVTSGVVDGILAGRAAGTLRRFEIENCSLKEGGLPRPNPVGPEDLLDLVEGCPKLTHIECHLASPYHEFQGEEAQESEHILVLRDPRGYLLLHY